MNHHGGRYLSFGRFSTGSHDQSSSTSQLGLQILDFLQRTILPSFFASLKMYKHREHAHLPAPRPNIAGIVSPYYNRTSLHLLSFMGLPGLQLWLVFTTWPCCMCKGHTA